MDLTSLTNGILRVDAWVWQPLAMPLVLLVVGVHERDIDYVDAKKD